jgi:hypothetical protein
MTIDLTGPAPHLVESCDCCGDLTSTYRLLGTVQALCRACFVRWHG